MLPCIYEYGLQLNLLKENIKKSYPSLNIKFAIRKEIINKFNLDDTFFDVEKLESVKDTFGRCEELKCNPKINPIEQYCIENKINLCVHNEKPISTGFDILIFTQGNGFIKDLNNNDLDKIKRIFGKTIKENPQDFINNFDAKFVVGVSNWQIFYAAYKKIPTFIISNNEGTTIFEKMFPSQKKIAL